MRLINKINLNHLRVFEVVYRLSSMTSAAQELKLTQPGISQHIKSLETALNLRLFERDNQLLLPTPSATNLYLRCSQGLQALENTLLEITGEAQSLEGEVVVGTPPEFGDAVLIPKLANFLNNHRDVKITVKVGESNDLVKWVLNGQMAFAFINSFTQDKRISSEPIYDEAIELCILQSAIRNLPPPSNRRAFYELLDFVSYVEDEEILQMWFKHHLKSPDLDLKIRALGTSCHSVGQLVVHGVGAAVLPGEQIDTLERQGHKLYRFDGCRRPLINPISVIQQNSRTISFVAKTLLSWIKATFREESPTSSNAIKKAG